MVAIDKADEAQLLATIDRWVEREVAPRVKEFDHAELERKIRALLAQ